MEYEIDRVVKKCEETMAKLKETEDHLKDAESILNKCLELCKSYFDIIGVDWYVETTYEEREFKKAQKEAQQEETDYKGGKAYYTFLNMFYKNKKENDKSKKTDKK